MASAVLHSMSIPKINYDQSLFSPDTTKTTTQTKTFYEVQKNKFLCTFHRQKQKQNHSQNQCSTKTVQFQPKQQKEHSITSNCNHKTDETNSMECTNKFITTIPNRFQKYRWKNDNDNNNKKKIDENQENLLCKKVSFKCHHQRQADAKNSQIEKQGKNIVDQKECLISNDENDGNDKNDCNDGINNVRQKQKTNYSEVSAISQTRKKCYFYSKQSTKSEFRFKFHSVNERPAIITNQSFKKQFIAKTTTNTSIPPFEQFKKIEKHCCADNMAFSKYFDYVQKQNYLDIIGQCNEITDYYASTKSIFNAFLRQFFVTNWCQIFICNNVFSDITKCLRTILPILLLFNMLPLLYAGKFLRFYAKF